MIKYLKDGYTFFARYDDEVLVATLTLKDEDVYKDLITLQDKELEFISKYSNINKILDDDTALAIMYDSDTDNFISAIKIKTIIGEYNDQVVWNDKISALSSDCMNSISKLNDKLSVNSDNNKDNDNKNEGRLK